MRARKIKLVMLVVLAVGTALTGLFSGSLGNAAAAFWEWAAPPLFIILAILYWRGWEQAAIVAVVVVTLLVGLVLPEPFVSREAAIIILLPSAMAMLLVNPLWVVVCTIVPIVLLLARANWQGVYADPDLLAMYSTVVGLNLLSRMLIDHSRREAEAALARVEVQAAELAQQRDALSESEARYRLIAEHVGDLVCLLDQHGHFLYASPSFHHVLGYNTAELIGQHAFSLVHPADLPGVLAQWEQVQIVGQGVVNFRYRHLDGSWRWFDSHGALLIWQGIPMAVIVGRHTTEQRRLSAQVEQIQKIDSIGRLAGGIAHDFNNFLTVMLGHVELAASLPLPPGPLRNELDGMRGAVERASGLTRQLLAFARSQVVTPQVLDLNVVVLETSSLLRRLIGSQISLVVRTAPDLWLITIDPSQLEQIILNLAINGRDAMPEGGQLVIETANVELDAAFVADHLDTQPGAHVLLTISDTGVGMSDEVKQHLFEPFFTTKPPGRGTGLGLATCYGIVKQNGGSIWLQSELGQGTTVQIYLPRATGARTVPTVQAEPTKIVHCRETVLVVDDNENVRQVVVRMLAAEGYRVYAVSSPAEALHIFEQFPPPGIDLLVTDVMLPQMTGKQLAEQVKANYSGLKVLYISGYTDHNLVARGMVDADIQFLAKPFSAMNLAQKVRAVLDA